MSSCDAPMRFWGCASEHRNQYINNGCFKNSISLPYYCIDFFFFLFNVKKEVYSFLSLHSTAFIVLMPLSPFISLLVFLAFLHSLQWFHDYNWFVFSILQCTSELGYYFIKSCTYVFALSRNLVWFFIRWVQGLLDGSIS